MLARRIYIRTISTLVMMVVCFSTFSALGVRAQTPSITEQIAVNPQVLEQSIKREVDAIAENSVLTNVEKEQVLEIYRSAVGRLSDGGTDRDDAEQYINNREKSSENVVNIREGLAEILDDLNDFSRDLFQEIDDQKLELGELEQTLALESSRLSVLRGELVQLQSDRTILEQFSTDEPVARAANDQKIVELSTQMRAQQFDTLTGVDKASYALAQASMYARQQSNTELNARKDGLSAETNLLAVMIEYKTAQITQESHLVNALRIKTGSARTLVAEQKHELALRELTGVVDKNPLLQAYARGNVDMSLQLLELAQAKEDLPAIEARINRQIDQVKFDRNITDQILDTKTTSRSYGVHLRELRQQQPSFTRIRLEMKARNIELQDVLFQKIITQEALELFNASALDITAEIAKFEASADPSIVPYNVLEATDIATLRALYESRRDILNALASYSVLKTRNLGKVNALQARLLDDVLALCALLDGRLLWLPSTETVGFAWPGKVLDGLQHTLRAKNIAQLADGFGVGLKNNFFFVFIAVLILGLVYTFHERFKPLLSGMGSRVGRVQKDSYILTPIAIVDGMVRAVPWALIPLLIGLIFNSSTVDTSLAVPLMRTCLLIAGLTFFGMTLREWCHKGALFDLHFRVDDELRGRLIKHLPWLLVAQALSVMLIGATRYNLDYDSGASALGELGFLIGAISLSIFTFKISWARSKAFKGSLRDSDGIYLRHEKWFFMLAMVVPAITAILTLFGYYETARLLLARFFVSFGILMTAYVLHGLFRRTVVIAQRRLALEQARARRDQAVKTRMEKVAAEERGEIPVPSLDYDRIDLETINRQSSQLVNIFVFIGTVGVLWALWSSLLPALSVFNDVEIWGYDKVDTAGRIILDADNGRPIREVISFWNLLQAFGIGFVTWLAARNLPGFLEIFVLKRMNMEQSSRFAIVTVLGYIIFIIGVLVAFDKLGTQWAQLQWIVAALSVGIGLGLQAIFANFVSGLIILFERPVRIGDYITVGDISGTVTRIQIRATTLMDLDNKETLIPNQELVSQRVTNWTLTNSVTRLIVNVGIAYGSDTELAHGVMLETIKANPNVLIHPEPTVLFLGFGDSTLDFEIRVFLRDFVQRYIVSHELHMALDAALHKAGIEIAFPQRDLHIKYPGESATPQKPVFSKSIARNPVKKLGQKSVKKSVKKKR